VRKTLDRTTGVRVYFCGASIQQLGTAFTTQSIKHAQDKAMSDGFRKAYDAAKFRRNDCQRFAKLRSSRIPFAGSRTVNCLPEEERIQ
jgi:hypothetical protein